MGRFRGAIMEPVSLWAGRTIRTPSFSLVRARRAPRGHSMYYRAARALTIILPCRFASLTWLSGCSTRPKRLVKGSITGGKIDASPIPNAANLLGSGTSADHRPQAPACEDPCEPEVIEDAGEDRRRGLVPRAGGGADLAVGAGGPTLDLRRGPPVDLWQDQIRVDPVAVFYGDVQQRVQQARPQIVRL